MSSSRRLPLILAIVAACIAVDQATKVIAQATLPAGTIHLLNDLIRLRLSQNAGAFLSLGASLSPQWRFWIFTVVGALLLIPVTYYAATAPDLTKPMVVALAFVIGGGLSNLIDRIVHGGYVIDFLNFGIGGLRTGILNVADIFITFGALYVMAIAAWDLWHEGI